MLMKEARPPIGATPLQLSLYNRMREKQHNYKSLAKASGLGDTTVRDIIVGRSNRPAYDTLKKIADILECTVADLQNGSFADPVSPGKLPPELPASLKAVPIDLGPADLPIYGSARCGPKGVLIIPVEQMAVDWTYRPPQLKGVSDAFAVFVVGDSMVPMFRPGHVAWVHPHLPLQPGEGVLVIKHNDEAFVKELVRHNGKGLWLREYKPEERDFLVPHEEIRKAFRIIGSIVSR